MDPTVSASGPSAAVLGSALNTSDNEDDNEISFQVKVNKHRRLNDGRVERDEANTDFIDFYKRLSPVTFIHRRHSYWEPLGVKCLAQGLVDSGGDWTCWPLTRGLPLFPRVPTSCFSLSKLQFLGRVEVAPPGGLQALSEAAESLKVGPGPGSVRSTPPPRELVD